MTAIVVIAIIAAYIFVGGYVGMRFYAGRLDRYKDCKNDWACYDWHECAAFWIGFGWPLTLPMIAGATVSTRREAKTSRDERRHKQKLELIKAQEKLAREQKEKTLADVKFLVENGIHADVPGLYGE